MPKYYKISEAAEFLGVSVQTLRRWAKGFLVPDFVSPGGHRYYSQQQLEHFLSPLIQLARSWVSPEKPADLAKDDYCENSAVFQARLNRFSMELQRKKIPIETVALVGIVVGEIGNNSFDHNIGNWPDMPGVFFGYDAERRCLVLADRGQGVLKTLKRVRPNLETESDAVRTAFTESVSGRAPEKRGNGLKTVRIVVSEHPFALSFQSGDAIFSMGARDKELIIKQTSEVIHGTLAILNF